MTVTEIAVIAQKIWGIASMLHGGEAAKVKASIQRLSAAVVADLPDGSGLTEALLVAHADQIIAAVEDRRRRINEG